MWASTAAGTSPSPSLYHGSGSGIEGVESRLSSLNVRLAWSIRSRISSSALFSCLDFSRLIRFRTSDEDKNTATIFVPEWKGDMISKFGGRFGSSRWYPGRLMTRNCSRLYNCTPASCVGHSGSLHS
eukprot:c9288_g1_i1.p1 GENE.c9288_g1_i1~~c9288_g1_i1.p1  ORF type:complete len:127 (+),score=21.95 c9288_g1_i1:143-523(+)